ncbi:MAG: hypothetical protein JSS02_17220 [Planctomycetes bacterium]|nr:hypothetical protein [Planctomycetota bacterium]
MRGPRWMIAGLLLFVAVGVVWSALENPSTAQEKAAAEKKTPAEKKPVANAPAPFVGKILLVQKKSDNSPQFIQTQMFMSGFAGWVLENPSLFELGGVRFLAGQGIEKLNDKPLPARILIPLEQVGTVLEFDDMDAFKAYEESQTEKMRQMPAGINFNMALPVPGVAQPVEVEQDAN